MAHFAKPLFDETAAHLDQGERIEDQRKQEQITEGEGK
jgi:hypothetical protein